MLSVIAVIILVAGGLTAATALIFAQPPTATSLAGAKPGAWSSVTLPSPAVNSDGSAYQIFVKPGAGAGAANGNVMIFFGDGGMTWNGSTTLQPVTLQSSVFGGGNFFTPNVPFYTVKSFGGVLSTDSRNPFADFTSIYIPTTTGDLGIGDAVATFGESGDTPVSANFNGYNNTTAALDWVYANVADPAKVLVAGSGTGGLTAAFYLKAVGDHYSTAALYEYSDSAYYAASEFPYVIIPVWQSQFQARFGFTPTRNPMKDAVTFNTAQFGDRLTTLISQSLLDKTDAAFSADIDDGGYSPQSGSDWNYGMKQTMRALRTADQPPQLFLTNYGANQYGETQHILATNHAFFDATEDGVTLDQWLASAVIDDNPISAGVGYLTQ